jgi:hypothetical protein
MPNSASCCGCVSSTLCFTLTRRWQQVWCSEGPEKVISARIIRAIVAMLHAILLILTRIIDIVFEFSPFSLCIEGCEPCVLRSSHAVIPRRSLNAHVDTYIIQQIQRYKIHEHVVLIAGL